MEPAVAFTIACCVRSSSERSTRRSRTRARARAAVRPHPVSQRRAVLAYADRASTSDAGVLRRAYGTLHRRCVRAVSLHGARGSIDWTEAAIDPEMLGRAFESLMASPERRKTGAFFTPFSLVERVTDAGLTAVLGQRLAGDPSRTHRARSGVRLRRIPRACRWSGSRPPRRAWGRPRPERDPT